MRASTHEQHLIMPHFKPLRTVDFEATDALLDDWFAYVDNNCELN